MYMLYFILINISDMRYVILENIILLEDEMTYLILWMYEGIQID